MYIYIYIYIYIGFHCNRFLFILPILYPPILLYFSRMLTSEYLKPDKICVNMCVCLCIYIYIYTHTYMYKHTHIFTQILSGLTYFIYIYIYRHTHTHTHTHAYIHADFVRLNALRGQHSCKIKEKGGKV